jgi:hypothetical protein
VPSSGKHRRSSHRLVAIGEEQGRRIGNLLQPAFRHREDADFIGAAEAVLDRAEDPVLVTALTFEAQHRIDHMFEHARAGDRPILGDVPDEHQRSAPLLGKADQFLRGCADLAHGSRRTLDQIAVHGLDRIDHQHCRRSTTAEGGQYVSDRRRRSELYRRISQSQTPGAQPNLIGRFLARDIGDWHARQGKPRGRLQQQGRFSDAGIAADQRRRSFDESAAQRAIELLDAGRRAFGQRDIGVEANQSDRASARLQVMLRRKGRHRDASFLDQRVPFSAIDALPLPFGRDRAAKLTHKSPLGFCHECSLTVPE